MKKILSLIMLLAMCLSLGACSKDSEEEKGLPEKYLGVWKSYGFDTDFNLCVYPITLEKNGKVSSEYYNYDITWEYSKNDNIITINHEKISYKFNIVEENGLTILKFVSSSKPDYTDGDYYLCLEPDSELEEKYHAAVQKILYSNSTNRAKYYYNLLTELGDYRNSKELLSKFTVYPNQLRRINKVTTDAFGQLSSEEYTSYSYDDNVECYDFSNDAKIASLLGYYKLTFTYDENGVINGAYLGSEDNMSLKVQIKCDANGNITSASFMDDEGKKWTNIYTYNNDGRLLEATVGEYERHCKYEYNKDGNLLMEVETYGKNDDSPNYISYEYDESGKLLIKEEYYSAKIGKDGTLTGGHLSSKYVYSYNENEDISSVDVKYYSSGKVEEEYVLEYIYEDMYRFNRN